MFTKLLWLLKLQTIFQITSKFSESHISMAFIVLPGKGGLRRWDEFIIAFLSGGRNEGVGNPATPKPCHESLSIQAVVHCRMYCLQWPFLKERRLWSQNLLQVSSISHRKTNPKPLFKHSCLYQTEFEGECNWKGFEGCPALCKHCTKSAVPELGVCWVESWHASDVLHYVFFLLPFLMGKK